MVCQTEVKLQLPIITGKSFSMGLDNSVDLFILIILPLLKNNFNELATAMRFEETVGTLTARVNNGENGAEFN